MKDPRFFKMHSLIFGAKRSKINWIDLNLEGSSDFSPIGILEVRTESSNSARKVVEDIGDQMVVESNGLFASEPLRVEYPGVAYLIVSSFIHRSPKFGVCAIGSVMFHFDAILDDGPPTLRWCYLLPLWRGKSVFMKVWYALRELHGEFGIACPQSKAMKGFLAKVGHKEGKWCRP